MSGDMRVSTYTHTLKAQPLGCQGPLTLSSKPQGSLSVCEKSTRGGEEFIKISQNGQIAAQQNHPATAHSQKPARLAGMQMCLKMINVGTFG